METKIKNTKIGKLKLSDNVIFFRLNNKYIRLYNINNRCNFIVTNKFASELQKGNFRNKTDEEIVFINATSFTLWSDMYTNPDFFELNNKVNKKIKFSKAIEILNDSKYFINYENKNNSFERFKGSINKQLGIESLYRRESLSNWWIHQKFNKNNLKKMNNNAYKFVQKNYVDEFSKKNLRNKTVLEVGCGHGFYSNIFSNVARNVEGFDYNQEYIDLAKKTFNKKNLKFFRQDITKINNDTLSKYDYIFLIDVYLFLFDKSFQNILFKKKNIILRNIFKLLKENGKLIIIDPHNFWLIPRFGESNKPFGIISEYNKPSFTSIPSLSERLEPLFKNNFALIKLEELRPNNKASNYMDEREFKFINEFPQWYSFTLKKISK